MFTIFCTLPFSSTQGFFCPWPQKFLSFFFLFFITASLWCISEYWLSLKSLNSIYLFYMLSLHLLFNAHSFQALISFRIRIWSYVWIDLLFFSFLSLSWFFFFGCVFQITSHSCFISAAEFYRFSSIIQLSCLLK